MKQLLFASSLSIGVVLADQVTDWNAIMLERTAAENSQTQARFAAITHLAVFEAVNAIGGGYEPYLRSTRAADPSASPQAAAIAAAHGVLKNYFPSAAATLDGERARSLASIPDGASKTSGIAAGEAAAGAVIALRANDGASATMTYTPVPGAGVYQPTPPAFAAATLVHWGRVTPFGLARNDQFRPGPPPGMRSAEYRRDYDEVKSVGGVNSTTRPDDRADLARFASRAGPVAVWNSVAKQVSEEAPASLAANARLFALVNMAMCDAGIAVFEAKYFYRYWRPVTAIRDGDSDGNPRTEPDRTYTPFIATPAYPSYPSGQGGLSNAARSMIEELFGRGRHGVTLESPALPGLTLRYTKLRHITDDIADARVYGGLHFRFEQDVAETLGERVARYLLRNHLRCVREDGCDGGQPSN
jgi:hypothetical protein